MTPLQLILKARRICTVLYHAVKKFLQIDGMQWAGSFAFNAFFSLFPLMVLFVTIASTIIDRDRAGLEIITYIESYIPIGGEMQSYIFNTIGGVVEARGEAGVFAVLLLLWAGLQCFVTLISVTDRAWNSEGFDWWRLPLKSLVLLIITAGAVLLGIATPMLAKMARDWLFSAGDFSSWIYSLGSFSISLFVVFLGLNLFYKLVPRRSLRFADVWVAALLATLLLQAAKSLFGIYLSNFATLNAVYGAFGGIIALLLWIYISGCVFIFGVCLCATMAAENSSPADEIPPDQVVPQTRS